MLSRCGSVAIGKQLSLGTAALSATIATTGAWLRATDVTGCRKKFEFAKSKAWYGTLDRLPHFVSRSYVDGTITFEAEKAALQVILEHMLGAATVANVLTPVQSCAAAISGANSVGNAAPLTPMTIWYQAPTDAANPNDSKVIQDAQITKLTVKGQKNDFVICTIDFIALDLTTLGAAITPVLPATAFTSQNLGVSRGVTALTAEDIEVTLEVKIKFNEGFNGSAKYSGFIWDSGEEVRMLSASCSFWGTDNSEAAYEAATTGAYTINLVAGANIVRFTMPTAQILTREISGAYRMSKLGLIATRDPVTPFTAFTANFI